MEFIQFVISFILHIDKHLVELIDQYQSWTYLILFLIVFCETGLVVTPFLPGDSLLFAGGAICAMTGSPLQIEIFILLLISAAFIGDNTNFFIGKFFGHKVYEKNYKLIKREYLDKTHAFYEKHGGKTLIIARFMPILRTFAPFVAGVGTMTYKRFITFSIVGNLLWVISFSVAGYLFGNIPIIKQNFTLVVFGIIILSLLPTLIAVGKGLYDKYKSKA